MTNPSSGSKQAQDLQEIATLTFERPRLSEGWSEIQGRVTYEKSALRSNGGAILLTNLPGNGFRRFRIEMEVTAITGSHLTYSDGTIATILDLTKGQYRITYCGPGVLAESRRPITPIGRRTLITFDSNSGRIRGLVDGEEVIAADDPDPTPFSGHLELGIWDDCLVHSIRIFGGHEAEGPTYSYPPGDGSFHLEMAVDFVDDMMRAPWTGAMIDDLFARFKRWGIKRCHWYYYGKKEDGLLQYTSGGEKNISQTLENVGDVFPAAIRAAHAHGIEIFAVLKPFDLGFNASYGESTPEAEQHGKLSRIGGPIGWVANFIAKRRDLLMARKPGAWGAAINDTFTRIDLVKEDALPAGFSVDDLSLFVSDDNTTYVPYTGPLKREEVVENYQVWEHTSSGGRPTGQSREARVMRLSGLEIGQKYFLIAIGGESKGSFANSLINLIHVFGTKGEERRLTFGAEARKVWAEITILPVSTVPNFLEHGVEFDRVPGVPTACFAGYDAIGMRWTLDGGERLLALARGKDPSPVAALSPSFEESRAWWISWLRDCLEAGADGIELRMRNHHSPFAWAEFGFEKPVRDIFLQRHGVDLWETDDFDREAWRRLRGEDYTTFCREAKKLAVSYGKPLGVNISLAESMEPHWGAAMEIHWDWRTWIDEGIVDSITMKDTWPKSRLAEEILVHSRPKKIQVIFSPDANHIWGTPGGPQLCEYWIRMAREGGCNGYQFYENVAIIKATTEGRIFLEPEEMDEVFRRHAEAFANP